MREIHREVFDGVLIVVREIIESQRFIGGGTGYNVNYEYIIGGKVYQNQVLGDWQTNLAVLKDLLF